MTSLLESLERAPAALEEQGQTSGGDATLAWGADGITLTRADGAVRVFNEMKRFAVQLSRSTGEVRRNWLMRALGRETRVEHRVHAELRSGVSRDTLTALAPNAAWAEGLPELPKEGGLHIGHDALVSVLCTARALGGTLTWEGAISTAPGAPAVTVEDTTPDAIAEAIQERDAAVLEKKQLERELRQLRETKDDERESLNTAELTLQQTREALDAAESERDALRKERDALQRDVSTLERARENAQKRKDRTAQERDNLQTEVRRLTTLLAMFQGNEEKLPMKTLDQVNRERGLTAHLDDMPDAQRAGVACPQCHLVHDEVVEMLCSRNTAVGGLRNNEFSLSWAESRGIDHAFTTRVVWCIRCGYEGWMFAEKGNTRVNNNIGIEILDPGPKSMWITHHLRKIVKDIPLPELKTMVDNAPCVIPMPRKQIPKVIKKLQELGATVRSTV